MPCFPHLNTPQNLFLLFLVHYITKELTYWLFSVLSKSTFWELTTWFQTTDEKVHVRGRLILPSQQELIPRRSSSMESFLLVFPLLILWCKIWMEFSGPVEAATLLRIHLHWQSFPVITRRHNLIADFITLWLLKLFHPSAKMYSETWM